jgi:hypothetical protein
MPISNIRVRMKGFTQQSCQRRKQFASTRRFPLAGQDFVYKAVDRVPGYSGSELAIVVCWLVARLALSLLVYTNVSAFSDLGPGG